MAHNEVKTVRDVEIKSWTRADSFYHCAPLREISANAVKVCGNTYLHKHAEVRNGGDWIIYYLSFHGSRIIAYHPDGSITLDMHGFTTNTTRHRINQFSPLMVSQVAGKQVVRGRAAMVNGNDLGFKIDPAQAVTFYRVGMDWEA